VWAIGICRIEALNATDFTRVVDARAVHRPARRLRDAPVLAIVERLGEPKLATVDLRPLSISLRHVETLELLPASIVGRRC
jgi:hypothetical protein